MPEHVSKLLLKLRNHGIALKGYLEELAEHHTTLLAESLFPHALKEERQGVVDQSVQNLGVELVEFGVLIAENEQIQMVDPELLRCDQLHLLGKLRQNLAR